jgi:hypothetical protein
MQAAKLPFLTAALEALCAGPGGTVNSRGFQGAFEAESGRSLQPLFDAWVYAAG